MCLVRFENFLKMVVGGTFRWAWSWLVGKSSLLKFDFYFQFQTKETLQVTMGSVVVKWLGLGTYIRILGS